MKNNSQISQRTLKNYRVLENKIADLGHEFADLKATIITSLDGGASVELGERTADIQSVPRTTVSWKQVVIRLKSAGYVRRILAATKPTFYFKLTVR